MLLDYPYIMLYQMKRSSNGSHFRRSSLDMHAEFWKIPVIFVIVMCLGMAHTTPVEVESYIHANSFTSLFSPQFPERIIYNRVPKCGSTTNWMLFKEMSTIHGFNHEHSMVFGHNLIETTEEIADLVKKINNYPTPMLYDRHVRYVNFSNYAPGPPPVYINMIREPVEQFISLYFYKRFTSNIPYHGTEEDKYRSIEECIYGGYSECESGANIAQYFFCGHHVECSHKDTSSLDKAIHTLDEYAVVGILERYQEFLYVLECMFPSYFSGIQKVYLDSTSKRKTVGKKKPVVSSEVKALLKERLSLDVVFYDVVSKRFDQLLLQVQAGCDVEMLW